jgi:hypothetical protein
MVITEINHALIKKYSKMGNAEFLRAIGVKKGYFLANPIKILSLQNKKRDDDSFAYAYKKNVTAEIFRYAIFKAHNFENVNLCVFSPQQRSGKSGVALSYALFLAGLNNYKFGVKDIYGSQHGFLSDLENRVFNSVAVVDEYIEAQLQIGSYAVESSLADISKITAKLLLHSMQIYRYLPENINALIALEPIGKDIENGQTKCLVHDLENYNSEMDSQILGYAIIPHFDPTIGKVNHFELKNLKHPTLEQRFRLEYEDKKDLWNKEVLSRNPTERAKERLK